MKKRILVVCSGNTCRSPMAAGLIGHRLEAENLSELIGVDSVGVRANDGQPATHHGAALLAERGISVDAHRSRRLQHKDLTQADLVLVMTSDHRRDLEQIAPDMMDKVLLFSALIPDETLAEIPPEISPETHDDGRHIPVDIADPYGQSKAIYAATLLQLDEILEKGWATIVAGVV